MHRKLLILMLLLGATLVSAQQKPATHHTSSASPAATNLPSEATINAFLKQMFGYQDDLSWKIQHIKPSPAGGLSEVDVLMQSPKGAQDLKFYVTEDGHHAIAGDLMPFGTHPFEAKQKQLQSQAFGPAQGPASSPVTVVEFSDLQCPHCKAEQPNLQKLLTEDKNVRLVFQNFPLPAHDWARKAAEYADCIGRTSNEAFWKFIQGVYDSQSDITAANADEKLTALADKAGAKGSEVAACAAKPETATRVQRSEALGKELGVNATPTMFINGREVPGGIPYEVLKKLVDFAATQARAE